MSADSALHRDGLEDELVIRLLTLMRDLDVKVDKYLPKS
jgi:hypothetical protein